MEPIEFDGKSYGRLYHLFAAITGRAGEIAKYRGHLMHNTRSERKYRGEELVSIAGSSSCKLCGAQYLLGTSLDGWYQGEALITNCKREKRNT